MARKPSVRWNESKQRWMAWVRFPDGARRKVDRVEKADAQSDLDELLTLRAQEQVPLEAARTRGRLAGLLADSDRAGAVAEARLALDGFEALGAGREADATIRILDDLGVHARRSGPPTGGDLTRRENEVLELVANGLLNPDIADRLYISRKTVEHHVASILRKLGVRNRTEAAAVAVRRG